MKVNPIYLRYVVEGLSNQSILPVPELLPHGLEPLFEDWVRPCQRHGTGAMHILWAFAAFREPFTPEEVSRLTGCTMESVLEVIQNHSHLFNRTSEGGYVLFHEQFKVYVLGTTSEHQLEELHRRIAKSLKEMILNGQDSLGGKINYAYRHIGHHNLCGGMPPEQMALQFHQREWLMSFQNQCPQNGWVLIRSNLHQVRIHLRYNGNDEIIQCLLHEIRISLLYEGSDVKYADGENELKIDHECDFVSHVTLALLHAQSGDWETAKFCLHKSSNQIKTQWGNGTLTATLSGEDLAPYFTSLHVLEQLVRVAVEKGHAAIAFETLEIIEEGSWAGAVRIMMDTCCRCGREDVGAELLRFLTRHRWNGEEEHPLEVAAKLGSDELVLASEELVETRDFQYALYQLILTHLKNKEYSKANPVFSKLMTTAKSEMGLAPVQMWSMVVSILGRSQGNSQKLEGAKVNFERCLESLGERDLEWCLWSVVNECREIDRLSSWLESIQAKHNIQIEVDKNEEMLPATVGKDKGYIQAKQWMDQAFPGFLSCSGPFVVPEDWPKRGFCGALPPSMAMIRFGLSLEWYARRDLEIKSLLGIELP